MGQKRRFRKRTLQPNRNDACGRLSHCVQSVTLEHYNKIHSNQAAAEPVYRIACALHRAGGTQAVNGCKVPGSHHRVHQKADRVSQQMVPRGRADQAASSTASPSQHDITRQLLSPVKRLPLAQGFQAALITWA
jgi:hypothetical protein